ncbi:hypothetical protein RRF57_007115 [Xylaria bambusicola]|uniref:Uncharacterized protein n=1 Tax=Xylaria bambusicola TaxID=326684 RepID=A0AAN7ZA75_9PEZI
MITQLNFDILPFVCVEMVVTRRFKAAIKLALVSQVVYNVVYRSIIQAQISDSLSKRGSESVFKSTMLVSFIKSDNATLVAEVLEHKDMGIDVFYRTSNSGSIISFAASVGAASVVELLAQCSADLGNRREWHSDFINGR